MELDREYSIKPTFLEALAIRNSIPITWRKSLSKNFDGNIPIRYKMNINSQEFDLKKSVPRDWYQAIVKGSQQEIKRKHTWITELSQPNEEVQIDWEAVYTLPYKVIRDTKIQSFQYRVIHHIITCKKYLRDIRMKQESACNKCGEEDTITHFFVSCPSIGAFWDKIYGWCDNFIGLKLDFLTDCELLLGMTKDNGNPKVFRMTNWLILAAKYYIHRQRLFHDGEVCLNTFLAEIRKKTVRGKIGLPERGQTS